MSESHCSNCGQDHPRSPCQKAGTINHDVCAKHGVKHQAGKCPDEKEED